MKIGWGTRVTILYCSFVVMIIALVVISVSQDFHLVSDDYYEEEIKYQNKIDKLKNSAALSDRLSISYDPKAENVVFIFPINLNPEGNILFYRPSDATRDFDLIIQPDQRNSQSITTNKLLKGLWKIKVDWASNGIRYFDEQTIIIQ